MDVAEADAVIGGNVNELIDEAIETLSSSLVAFS
jgi:hypothetical protein